MCVCVYIYTERTSQSGISPSTLSSPSHRGCRTLVHATWFLPGDSGLVVSGLRGGGAVMTAGGRVATRLTTRSRLLHSTVLFWVKHRSLASTWDLDFGAMEFDGETELENDMEAMERIDGEGSVWWWRRRRRRRMVVRRRRSLLCEGERGEGEVFIYRWDFGVLEFAVFVCVRRMCGLNVGIFIGGIPFH